MAPGRLHGFQAAHEEVLHFYALGAVISGVRNGIHERWNRSGGLAAQFLVDLPAQGVHHGGVPYLHATPRSDPIGRLTWLGAFDQHHVVPIKQDRAGGALHHWASRAVGRDQLTPPLLTVTHEACLPLSQITQTG